ncbi:TonB-dependent siderophore receptor [Candidatus Nitrosoglobus terrae]|uniref:TonB-dependent siderophore receptor n=1 Tax=Candidatus Nitrosoglobus terrae TaxID=1630141 RepID=A0A1Q2SN00_9GAMM|nr:TonB-dependent siderophore receptor [Candidatus Nitrosoglobus terrae]BAW80491.1 TonB-dependent siderophore receptor [Candidatus Nitrosoglobus terrae]
MEKYRRLAPLAIGLCCAWASCGVLADSDQEPVKSTYKDKKDKYEDRQEEESQPARPSVFSGSYGPNATELGTVTVTGNQLSTYHVDSNTALGTETRLLDTPFSITPIPRKVLTDQASQSLEQAVRNSPGVTVNLGEGNQDQLVIRGVSTAFDFFMNGMRDDAPYFRPLYNVDHIDVLKGPAALQFGRGGAGGLVNFVTKKAERREIRHIMVEGGGGADGSPWGHFRGQMDFGTSISDFGAFRFMGMGQDSGTFRDFGFIRRYAANPVFHFDINDRTQMDLTLSYLNDTRLADRGIPSQNGLPVDVGRSQFFGSPQQNRFDAQVTTAQLMITHEVNDDLKLMANFRAFQNNHHYDNLYPGSSVNKDDMFAFKGYDHSSERINYQQRLQAIFDFDTGKVHHKLLGGGDYTWQRDFDIQFIPGKSKDLPGLFALDNSVVGPVAMTSLDRHNNVHADEIGVYLQDQITFDEHWMALAGVRFDRFATDARYLKINARTQRIDDTWSPRAALMYKPVENDTLYFSFSRNFIPSGANVAASLKDPNGANLAPERSDQYEFGNKFELFDGNMVFNIAFFQIDLTNMPAADPNGDSQLLTIGRQRNRGIELSANGSITEKWNIFANYTYMMEAKNMVAVQGTAAGARAGLVPRNQFSVWSTYDINEHWGFGGGVHGQSMRYASFTDKVQLPAYAIGDLMAYYQLKGYRFQVNLNNVSDETYYATASGDNQIMPGIPRSVFASVNMDF